MTVSTYYYPAANGGGENVSGGAPNNFAGTTPFFVQFQSTPGSYTKVVYDTTNPTQTVVTFNYGTNNPVTETLQITQYGNSSQVETSDGTYNYLLSNTPLSAGQFYPLAAGGSQAFVFNPAYTANPVCFEAGTRIRTSDGEVAVEKLEVGDLLLTTSGVHRPICWLGHRNIDCRRHPSPHEVMPVRIAAHAFGVNRPSRDLRVSPGHAICVDVVGELLIPAGTLVNGTTIVQEQADTIIYWHVELEGGQDIIIAENLPCESYIEMGNRSFFAETEAMALHAYPDARAVTHANFCRAFHKDGPVVAFVRERLAARSSELGWTLEVVPFASLHLLVDGRRVEAETNGLSARFLVPALAKELWLVSETSVPAEVGMAPDLRSLGVCVGSLVIDDGFGSPRIISADDPTLSVGFHNIEEGPQRWTAGRARLPAELWDGCHGGFFLRLELTRPALPRWVAPNVLACDRPLKLAC